MNKTMLRMIGTACLFVGLAAPTGFGDDDDEENVPLKKLPKAVKKAVKKAFPNGKMIEAEKEKEKGVWIYEVEVEAKGKKWEIEVTPEGKVLEIEEDD